MSRAEYDRCHSTGTGRCNPANESRVASPRRRGVGVVARAGVVLLRGELQHRGAAAWRGRVRVDGDHVRGDAHRDAAAARRANRRTAV